jgi:hypothetical protein
MAKNEPCKTGKENDFGTSPSSFLLYAIHSAFTSANFLQSTLPFTLGSFRLDLPLSSWEPLALSQFS